jgi:thiol-disulfide isomerase/thioredoxin
MSSRPESGIRIRNARRRRWVVGLLGVLGIGLGVATALPLHAQVRAGDPFPELAAAGVVNLAGGELPALAGKVALVDFWASWCAPCKAAFPALAKLHQEYAARGLVIAAVSVDEKPAAATAFWKRMAPPFPTLHDREQKLVKQVQVPVMPTTYLLGRDGRVRAVQPGFHGATTEKELRRQIEALLAEK